jgi:sacsin
LILDPHREWSDGGNVYDFVAKPADPEDAAALMNHLAAFSSIMDTAGKPLNGTIIRVPLRTAEQATNSKILDPATATATTVPEVSKVLQSFSKDFGDSGLLFLRNLAKLEITSADMSITINVTDSETLRS